MLCKSDLQFEYPESLVATSPARNPRVLWYEKNPWELSLDELLEKIDAGDLLVINETKVLKRRVFAGDIEILFLRELEPDTWEVLFPSRAHQVGDVIKLPEDREMRLLKKGRPQMVEAKNLTPEYFEKHGEVPLPPYIQKARGHRHARSDDDSWYQTFWAKQTGSLAAPTASLHFRPEHFAFLKSRSVSIAPITLHVGLGTFLPVTVENLNEHVMHTEEVEIPAGSWRLIQETRARGRKVWAVGTTVARALESAALGKLQETPSGYRGETDLLILPGFEWKVVDRLMTNFHQPESTLLALVSAFAGLHNVKSAYAWAIEKRFRLFSYGDLSVWSR